MKKLYFLLALAIVSCSPQGYTILLETRQKSPSGLDLGGKQVALVYMENDNPKDTLFNNFFADGIQQRLESSLPGMDIFSLKNSEGGIYSDKDTLVRLIMDTDSDVVMLLDNPEYVEGDSSTINISKLYVYDSMDKSDEVRTFSRTSVIRDDSSDLMLSDAQFSAYEWAEMFVPEWKQEQFTFLYYNEEQWINALSLADDMEFARAMDIWLQIVENANSTQKISCAAYNIALCNYLLSRYELAAEWLDMSDKTYPVSLSAGLRKRISEAE